MTDEEAFEFEKLAERVAALEQKQAGLDGMTLAQIEAMAERLGSAAKVIRDAQALLGAPAKVSRTVRPEVDLGEPAEPEPVPHDSVAAHRLRQFQPPEQAAGGKLRLGAGEKAAKAALMGQFEARAPVDPDLPDDIKQMESAE